MKGDAKEEENISSKASLGNSSFQNEIKAIRRSRSDDIFLGPGRKKKRRREGGKESVKALLLMAGFTFFTWSKTDTTTKVVVKR